MGEMGGRMPEAGSDYFAALQRRYRERDLPWDRALPPPEVIDTVAALPPGRALDLGCGAGRACIYLARAGWRVDGVDFVPEAIDLAAEQVAAAGVSDRVTLHQGSVAQLDFLQPPYDLAIDVGCMHALSGANLLAYAAEVARLVSPGGRYLLFAHLRGDVVTDGPVGIAEGEIVGLFRDTFAFERVEHGITEVNGQRWSSAWFYLRRTGAAGEG